MWMESVFPLVTPAWRATGFPSLSTIDILDQIILCWGTILHTVTFVSSTYEIPAAPSSQFMTNQNSQHCQMSPKGKIVLDENHQDTVIVMSSISQVRTLIFCHSLCSNVPAQCIGSYKYSQMSHCSYIRKLLFVLGSSSPLVIICYWRLGWPTDLKGTFPALISMLEHICWWSPNVWWVLPWAQSTGQWLSITTATGATRTPCASLTVFSETIHAVTPGNILAEVGRMAQLVFIFQ